MPKKKATTKTSKAKVEEPILDDELDDELDEELPDEESDVEEEAEDDLPDRDTYTAKQVATRIGTDAKTLRKFFRSSASTVEPVGQGGRYEFDAEDMPQIKQEFETWQAGQKRGRPAKKDGTTAKKKSRVEVADELEEEEELDLDEELEPTEDELDDLELEDEDLELEDED